MRKILLLVVLLMLFACCRAESDFPALQYLCDLGYQPEYLDASPGWRTCSLMCDNNWLSLNISDEKDAFSMIVLPEFAPQYDSSEIPALFVDLVQKFEWDISFYWPDYNSDSKIKKSYNIVNDLNNTEENYYDKSEYINALRNEFGLDPNSSSTSSTSEATEYTLESLASLYNDSSSESFVALAEYHPDLDIFTYSLSSTDISTGIWTACDAVVKSQYREKFHGIVKSIRESLDTLGFCETTVIATFQLCDGNAVYMMVDIEDFSNMITG